MPSANQRTNNRDERRASDSSLMLAAGRGVRQKRASLGYEPTGRRLQSPRGSQTRRSRLIARPSHRAASHPIAAAAPRFVHKSVHNKASSKCSRLGERSVPRCWWPIRWRCAVRAGTARPTSCWARQANPIRSMLTLS